MGQPLPPVQQQTLNANPKSKPAATQPHKGADETVVGAQLQAFLALLLGLTPAQSASTTARALPIKTLDGKALPSDGKSMPRNVAGKRDELLRDLLKFAGEQSIRKQVTGDKLDSWALATLKAALLKLEGADHGDKAQIKPALQQLLKAVSEASQARTGQAAATSPAAAAAQQGPQAHVTAARLPAPVVDSGPRFAQDMAEHVQWMTQSGQQFARVAVSPAHLGPIHIQIRLDGNQAQVMFGAHHEAARDALQTAVPRLREVLDSSGLQLVQVDVSGHGTGGGQQRGPDQPLPGAWFQGVAGAVAEPVPVVQGPVMTGRSGLVDDYA